MPENFVKKDRGLLAQGKPFKKELCQVIELSNYRNAEGGKHPSMHLGAAPPCEQDLVHANQHAHDAQLIWLPRCLYWAVIAPTWRWHGSSPLWRRPPRHV